jgi:hypothetical protein
MNSKPLAGRRRRACIKTSKKEKTKKDGTTPTQERSERAQKEINQTTDRDLRN